MCIFKNEKNEIEEEINRQEEYEAPKIQRIYRDPK